MRIIHLPTMLAAQLLSLHNEEKKKKPREEEKKVNLYLEEVTNRTRQETVPRGYCNAARYLLEQPGLKDQGHPSDKALRVQGIQK